MDLPATLQNAFTQFILFLPGLITALVVFIVTLYLAGIVSRIVKKALQNRHVAPHLVDLLGKVTRWAVIVLGTITALQQVHFNVTAFLTGLGIVGFAFGFALQDITQNFVAGILLILQQPFSVGDLIQVQGFLGHVQSIDLRATRLVTLDGEDVLIPNGDVFTSPITNFTLTQARRIEVEVGVAYDSDLDQVERVVLEAVSNLPVVLKEPSPQISIHTFGGSSIDLSAYIWVDARKTLPPAAYHQAVKAIKKAFDREGIQIPFPIRTVYMAS
jgi:small conductance mechanosensitive channel